MNTYNSEEALAWFERKAKKEYGWGIFLILWNIGMIISGMESEEQRAHSAYIGNLIFVSFCFLFGIWMLYSGHIKKKYVPIYRDYSEKLYGNKDALELNYAGIATIMDKSESQVIKDVKLFQKHNIWNDVHGGQDAVAEKDCNC